MVPAFREAYRMANLFAAGRLVNVKACPALHRLIRYFPEAEESVSFDAPFIALAASASITCFFPVIAPFVPGIKKRSAESKQIIRIHPGAPNWF